MSGNQTPIEIFCSYAHEDEDWQKKLKKHLSLLQRQGRVSFWYDRLVQPGVEWEREINNHLKSASLILLLISADFLASDYCYGVEMQCALERHKAGECRVIPILVRPVDNWQSEVFAQLQALPTDARFLTTWVNQDAALADVVAGIRRALEDLSAQTTSALHIGLPTVWNVPYPRNVLFTGREALLEHLMTNLRTGEPTALSQSQAISGLGGIGKTQLALEYAYRYSQDYQAVLWVQADTRENLTTSYLTLARLLSLPEKNLSEADVVIEAVKLWLRTHMGYLLILDNADELILVRDFLPPSLSGHLLLTTRAQATGRLARRLEVDILPQELGALFLLRRSGLLPPHIPLEQAPEDDQALARAICDELGGLPLALDQAGAYIEETGCSLVDYQHLYQCRRSDLLAQRRGLINDHPHPVATTWNLSFERVQGVNLVAADLLRLCAFLAPDAIPQEIITYDGPDLGPELASVSRDGYLLNQAIEALRAYSLVRREASRGTGGTLSVHRLVQAVLQDTMTVKVCRQWAERVVRTLNAMFPRVDYSTWKQAQPYLSHVEVSASLIERYAFAFPEAAALLYAYGRYLYFTAQYKQAEPFYQQALHIFEEDLGPEHPNTAATLQELAGVFQVQGKYAHAESIYQRALHIYERVLGPEHPSTAATLQELAGLFQVQGKYEQALPLYLSALRMREEALGPLHPDTATTLQELGKLFQAQGKYEQAELFYQRALRIKEQMLGSLHPDTAATLQELGKLFQAQGKYKQAELRYQRALRIREEALGSAHPSTATSLHELARLAQKLGQYEQAKFRYQQALSIREQQLGSQHPDTATSLNDLAVLYRLQGKYIEAEPLFQRARSIREQQLGSQHPDTATNLSDLAELYQQQGQYGEAKPLYERALTIREQQLGPEHPDTAISLNNLAILYERQSQYTQAEPLFQRALAIFEQQLGPEHPDTAITLNNLAELYQQQGQYGKAKPLYERALTICEEQLGLEHPVTAITRWGLADLAGAQGQRTEAKLLYERALRVFERLSPEHPYTHSLCEQYERLLHDIQPS